MNDAVFLCEVIVSFSCRPYVATADFEALPTVSQAHSLSAVCWRAVISIEFEIFKGRQLVDGRTSGYLAVDIRNSTFYHSHVLAISLFREIPTFCSAIKQICNGLPAFIADGVTLYRVYECPF